jgi:hypothetical protein
LPVNEKVLHFAEILSEEIDFCGKSILTKEKNEESAEKVEFNFRGDDYKKSKTNKVHFWRISGKIKHLLPNKITPQCSVYYFSMNQEIQI